MSLYDPLFYDTCSKQWKAPGALVAAACNNLVVAVAMYYPAAAADSACAGYALYNQEALPVARNPVCGILPGRRAQRTAD